MNTTWWSTVQRSLRALAVTGVLVLAISIPSPAGDISYVYDNLGRLLAVIDPATDTAVYAYDAVGNLTGITRQTSSTLAIFQFTPSSGPVGTAVTIYGTGFSATPASNTVKFNGTTATVATASTMVLTTTVPAGATTGTISVTVAAATATSGASFTIGAPAAPTLTSFTPTVGMIGSAVTLTGTNYDSMATKNSVTFSNAYATVTTASATALGVTVPVGAQSGKIGVATVNGSVTSANDFFVTPAGVAPADVQFTGRIVVGGSTLTATISIANKVGLVVFDGVAGQRVSLGMTSVTIPSSTVSLFKPDNTLLTYASYGSGGGALDSPVLPVTGTYTILIDPASTYTGSMALTLSAELTGNITIAGSPVVMSTTRVGQNARYFFTGTAGQTISLGMTSVTIPSSNVSLYKPDGSALVAPTSVTTAGGAIDTQILPVSGTYAIFVDPSGTNIGTITLTLYGTPDITGSITIDGTTVTPTLTVPGQRARYTFTGTAGQQVNLGLTSVSITSSTVSFLKPDETALTSTTIGTGGGSVDPPVLPSTGTYTIVVDPAGLYTGSMTLRFSSALTGSITLDGASVPISLTQVGQTARYTFTGTAGQWVNLGLSSVSITSSTLSMLKPDGTTLVSTSIGTAGGSLDPTTALPTTGTYTIFVDPASTYTGSITLTLSSALTGSVTLDGASVPISLTRIGQTARYTFSGTSGQWVSLGLTSVTLTTTNVTLLKPDGTTLASTSVGTAGGGLEPPSTLPTTGTYTLVVDPAGIYTGNITLTLMSYLTGALNLDGTATTSTIATVGQNALYTFSGTAGQWVSFGFTTVTFPSAGVTLFKPDGTTLTGTSIGTGGGSLDLPTALPTTGTYTLTVNPSGAYTGAMTITLSSEVTGSVTINAPATPVTIGRAGQNARETFAGTASQQVTVRITGNTLGSVTVLLYTPSGSYQTGASGAGASFNLPTVTLGTAGTYTIILNPSTTATGSLNLQVTNP